MATAPKLPVDTVKFWRTRVLTAIAFGRDLHTVIYDTDHGRWTDIQNITAGLLQRYVKPGQRVLDAGCGYGALIACIEQKDYLRGKVDYVGIDISPDLIDIGRIRYPARPWAKLTVGDLRNLSYPDQYFNWCVLRSMRGMLTNNLPDGVWRDIRVSIGRVSKNILVLEYADATYCHTFTGEDFIHGDPCPPYHGP